MPETALMYKLFVFMNLFLLLGNADSVEKASRKQEIKRKCPEKGHSKWCARLRRCVKPCKGCLEPRVVGEDYICGPRKCRVWEKCLKQKRCTGSISGEDYWYRPSDNDPCAERVQN
jgi:hypothetical protein